MLWLSQDQLNAVTLDEGIAEQLSDYLDKKEAQLSSIIGTLASSLDVVPGLSSNETSHSSHLNEAIEDFSRKIHRAVLSHSIVNKGQFEEIARKLNQALWNYVEILEGSSTELFQQLEQVGFEQWNADFVRALTAIKDELTHRIDDVTWAVRRLREQLKRYNDLCDHKCSGWLGWRKLFSWNKTYVDRAIEPALRKCSKFLNFRYRKFVDRLTGYLLLYDGTQKQLQKFYNYRVLSSLDLDQQDKYKQLFFFLQLWKKNNKARALPRSEPVRMLRTFASAHSILSLFKEYFSLIKTTVFDSSRMIKKQYRQLFLDKQVRQPLLDNLTGYRAELTALGEQIEEYKKFHTHTDPKEKKAPSNDQYPHLFTDLDKLAHEIKVLELLIVNFHSSLECEPILEDKVDRQVQDKIAAYIHEMEQPLASQDLMRREAKALLNALHDLDEMGSFDLCVVSFTRWTLIRAMCADWKYQVLQELPLFHHIYNVHQSIAKDDDRTHLNRLQRFQRVQDRIGLWVENNQTVKHAHDIELDINDIKAYLQDFFAHVQRIERVPKDTLEVNTDDDAIVKAEQALLEYLYLFGSFLHNLKANDPDHRQIRRQLLFVDQYFEEIQRKLQELRI